jgi:hypothetical protein
MAEGPLRRAFVVLRFGARGLLLGEQDHEDDDDQQGAESDVHGHRGTRA